MKVAYFKSLPNFESTNINIDRENGLVKNTCIANFGENKNDSYFDELFLNDLVKQGNESEKGIKSRFGHPNMCATSFGTYIGRYKNFRIENKNVYADLTLDPIAKKTQVDGKGITMFDYIMDMAESNPDMFGNSIHIFSDIYQKPIDGKVKNLHSLGTFKAVDLVDDPAATDSLFSANPNDLGIIVTQFLDDNPQIFETISKQPAIIEDFFNRYANYSNRKSLINFNMSFLEKLKKQFSSKRDDETFDIDVTLADGSIVTVVTEAEQPQVGDAVVTSEGTPVPDADHLLPDGGSIVTVGGKITEIKEAEPVDEPADETSMKEVMNSVNNLTKQFQSFKKTIEKSQKDNEEAFDVVSKEMKRLGKEIGSKKFEKPSAEQGSGQGAKAKTYDPEKAKEIREKK
ncbi:hypothetical protein [Flavobacterium sp.]|uniref:hypothetical protein n=1 Tax=Flavobacterium sp. TaxID=239 RepID=UPI0025BD2165|nr:hypothetical protein [Flavobacterium sp.]MBA4154154.1 hypothetical protein [Flavobacterium sp.]